MTDNTLSGEIRGFIHQARLSGGKWAVNMTINRLQDWARRAEQLEQAAAREAARASVLGAGGEKELYR